MYSSNLSDLLNPPPTLRRGDKGDDVCRLQYLISGLKIDGDFGSATYSAVKALQSKHGLTADGVVGRATWTVIMADRPDSFYAYPGCSTFSGNSSGSSTWTEIIGNVFSGSKPTTSTDSGRATSRPGQTSTTPIFGNSEGEEGQSKSSIGIFGWTMLGIAAASAGAIVYKKQKSKKVYKTRRRSPKKSSGSRLKGRRNVRAIIYE